MLSLREAAADFLAQKRIAVAGVSRTPGTEHGANVVYNRLRKVGYEVFAVNPNADEVEGDPCYHDLKSIPGGVDAVVIGTTPEVAEQLVRDCYDLGIGRVWMHRSFGAGSVSEKAADFGREHGMKVIAGGCPLMFGQCADVPHKLMKGMLTLTRGLPKVV